MFAAMREGDILVHHPYDSFATSVERFVRQAVADPDVLAIKQTVYRTSADSPLVPSLIAAAERGKQAVCMVELKARFDERANITWAKKLEQAGVHVVYGIPALKTHVKCILVVRREGDGVRHYAHVGTGNYNPKTARIYTDLGLFTCDEDLGSDIAEMFNYLTGYARPSGFRKALIAPHNLAESILAEIDRTIEAHTPERPARIRLKMNSLLDAKSIQALYRASQAGVEVKINVRGICALRPGCRACRRTSRSCRSSAGSSSTRGSTRSSAPTRRSGSTSARPTSCRATSTTGSSWSSRSRTRELRAELLDVLDRSLADNMNAWELREDGTWERRQVIGEPRSVQRELIERHQARASERRTALAPERRGLRDTVCAGVSSVSASQTARRDPRRPGVVASPGAPVEPRAPLAGDASADVVVVGGGFAGMWTAWLLREAEPEARVDPARGGGLRSRARPAATAASSTRCGSACPRCGRASASRGDRGRARGPARGRRGRRVVRCARASTPGTAAAATCRSRPPRRTTTPGCRRSRRAGSSASPRRSRS